MYEIFEQLLKERGLTIAEFSRLSGIAKSTLYDWRSGKFRLKDDKRRIVAEFFNVSLDYLDGRTKYRRSYGWEDDAKELEKPLYRASAGEGAYNDTYTSDSITMGEEGYEYATVVGDSMLPELRDGDVIKIEPTSQTSPRDFTLIKIDGEDCTVKFVEVVDNGIWVRALNKEVFEDRFYSIQDVLTLPITIIGKVVAFRRTFR